MLRNVRLYGHLGKKFGRNFKLDVKSPSEAIRALQANCPEFMGYLVAKHNYPGYRVLVGNAPVNNKKELFDCSEGKTIKIVPVIKGSGGVVQFFVGLTLVAVGFVTGNPYLIAMGSSMTFGGVASLLSPSPTLDEPTEDPENRPNYSFNGIVNTTKQGNPVPLIYGTVAAGGQVISAGFSPDNYDTVNSNPAIESLIGKLDE